MLGVRNIAELLPGKVPTPEINNKAFAASLFPGQTPTYPPPCWSRLGESNPRPIHYEGIALPTELRRRGLREVREDTLPYGVSAHLMQGGCVPPCCLGRPLAGRFARRVPGFS